MARRRFFVSEVRHQQAELLDEDARHLTDVLRVETGQLYEISDNHDVWLAEVETARKARVVFRIIEKIETILPAVDVTLIAALIRFERFETLLEKATELGAARVIPLEAARSEKGLEKAAPKRLARWRRIALEASQQSRRARLPEVAEPVRLASALAAAAPAAVRLLLDESRDGVPLLNHLHAKPDSVALLVGPEGGWTDAERQAALAAGWQPVSMGPLILRAETAALAALAVIQAAVLAAGRAHTANTQPSTAAPVNLPTA